MAAWLGSVDLVRVGGSLASGDEVVLFAGFRERWSRIDEYLDRDCRSEDTFLTK